jgi:hypothetical protein
MVTTDDEGRPVPLPPPFAQAFGLPEDKEQGPR